MLVSVGRLRGGMKNSRQKKEEGVRAKSKNEEEKGEEEKMWGGKKRESGLLKGGPDFRSNAKQGDKRDCDESPDRNNDDGGIQTR